MTIVPLSIQRPKLAFIGDAPTWEEKAPFTGTNARLFNGMLRGAGIDREKCLVTNVFNAPLPEDDVAGLCYRLSDARGDGATDLTPIGDAGYLRPEHRHHLARLEKELREWQPTVIVPLGGIALWALTGLTNIGAVRGTVQASSRVPGFKLVPTYHPSFVRKQFKYYSVVVGDFQKAVKEAERGREIIQPQRTLILEPTIEQVRESVPKLLDTGLLSVDIETGWGQITCIGFSPSPTYGICIPFVDLRTISRSYWPDAATEARAWGYVGSVLASDSPKLGQNFGGYDAFWLLEKYRMQVRNLQHDTRLMHHALFAELPKSLEFMQGYAQQGAWKSMGKHTEKRDD